MKTYLEERVWGDIFLVTEDPDGNRSSREVLDPAGVPAELLDEYEQILESGAKDREYARACYETAVDAYNDRFGGFNGGLQR